MVHGRFPAGEYQREAALEVRVHEDVGDTVFLAGLLPIVQYVPHDLVVVVAFDLPALYLQDVRASVLAEEDEPDPAQVASELQNVHVVAYLLSVALMRLHERVVRRVQLQTRQEAYTGIVDGLSVGARVGPVVEHDHGVLRQQLPECLLEVVTSSMLLGMTVSLTGMPLSAFTDMSTTTFGLSGRWSRVWPNPAIVPLAGTPKYIEVQSISTLPRALIFLILDISSVMSGGSGPRISEKSKTCIRLMIYLLFISE